RAGAAARPGGSQAVGRPAAASGPGAAGGKPAPPLVAGRAAGAARRASPRTVRPHRRPASGRWRPRPGGDARPVFRIGSHGGAAGVKALALIFRREVALAWNGGGGPLLALGFYAAVTTLIPLASGPSPERLAAMAPSLAWVALALAS